MSHIELPPQSLKRFLADEGGYSLNRSSDGKERKRVSDAYIFVGETIEPFMGEWIDGIKTDQYGGIFEQNRYAFSRPVGIEGDTWVFVVRENLQNIAGSEFPIYHIGGFDGKNKDSQLGLYVVTPGVVRARGIELKTQEEFVEFKRAIRFMAQHLVPSSVSSRP